jgi:hypothetical protein
VSSRVYFRRFIKLERSLIADNDLLSSRRLEMKHIMRSLVAILLIVAALLLGACGQGEEAVAEEEPAIVEEIPGSEFNRVILTQKAAERLDIRTEPVSEMEGDEAGSEGDMTVVQEGEVTDPDQGLVRVAFDGSSAGKVDMNQPARIHLQDDEEDEGFSAELYEPPDADEPGDVEEDGEDEDLAELFFAVDSAEHGLAAGQRVLVELPMRAGQRGVVPYSAIVYGLNGETWVYTNPESLTFTRQLVTVDYIEGGQVVLLDGPPPGTEVVTVGAALLLGADTGVGK